MDDFFEKAPVSFQFESNNFVKKMLEKYFNCLNELETCKKLFVHQLAKVIVVFNSDEIFAHLLTIGNCDRSWNAFYSKYIAVWINDKEISIDDVSQLIFTLLRYVVSEEDKQFVLHSLSEVS